MIFEEQFPVTQYTAASKIGNSVISLLLQLRCRCNSDHNKFSSSSNTIVLAIFPKLCLWRRSLCSILGRIGPKKLYRATLKQGAHIHQPTVGQVPEACAQPYRAGSGSHRQLFYHYWRPPAWQGRWVI